MFDELPSETLLGVTGGFRVDPTMVEVMLMAMQQIESAHDATLSALNDSLSQLMTLIGSRNAPAAAAPPILPIPFGVAAAGSTMLPPPPSP